MSLQSDIIDDLREERDKLQDEVGRLRNAARSRLKCPNGHSPSQSRGPCWHCDAERNASRLAEAEAALAQARKVAAAMDIYYHRQGCPIGWCKCGAAENNRARNELLAILEVKP